MNKTVLITGASRGIGRATALLFAENGYQVAANYCRSREAAESLKARIEQKGGVCRIYQADVADEAQVNAMVRQAEQELGEISVLINNAAVASQTLFPDTDPALWRRIFAVNTDGAYHCCRAVVPAMISRKEGCILNIASMWGEVGGSCEVAYSASKGALIAFTKALAKELSLSGIRVNCLSPGMIDTDMNNNLSPEDKALTEEEIPLGYSGKPEDVARAALFLCGGEASYITGQVLRVNGGMVV